MQERLKKIHLAMQSRKTALETTEAPANGSLRRPTRESRNSAIDSEPTLRRTWSGEFSRPQCAFEMSMRLCVLQFTLIIAAGCALHRRTSRVIHRIELYFLGFESKGKGQRVPPAFAPTGQQKARPRRGKRHGAPRRGPTRRQWTN